MQKCCELCEAEENLTEYEVLPLGDMITVCQTCHEQITAPNTISPTHWHCLSNSMWSENSAVQVMAYRLLKHLQGEAFAQDLLEQLYLEDDIKKVANSISITPDEVIVVKDSNGVALEAGDSVTVIKDLEVKGAGFTAKRGTVVKNISLNANPEQLEGRVNGTKIVLLAKFVKKM